MQVLYNCFHAYVFWVVRKTCFFQSRGEPKARFLDAGRGKGNIHGKTDDLWNGMGPCMYVGMSNFRGLHRQNWHPDIHTRRLTIHFFGRFCLKTWPLPWKWRFRVCEKTCGFPCWLYFSPFWMVIKPKTFSFEVVQKPNWRNERMYVWMYVYKYYIIVFVCN